MPDEQKNPIQLKLEKLTSENASFTKISDSNEEVVGLVYRCKATRQSIPIVKVNCLIPDKAGRKIACRHYSSYVIQQKLKGYHEQLATAESIRQIPFLYQNYHDNHDIDRRANTYTIFDLENLGEQLFAMAGSLDSDDTSIFGFSSSSHAMVLSLSRKANDQFVIKFYDPNDTNSHMRILIQSRHYLKHVKIDHLLTAKRQQRYFRSGKAGLLFEYEKPENLMELQGDFYPQVIIKTKRKKKVFKFTQQYAFSATMRSLLKELAVIPEQIEELLAADSRLLDKLYFDFSKAMYTHEHAQVLQQTITKILTTGLSEAAIIVMFEHSIGFLCEFFNGACPPFFYVMSEGYVKIAEVFLDKILSSALSEPTKIKLLASEEVRVINENVETTPALYMVANNGHADVMAVYLGKILDADLEEDNKFILLKGQYKNTPALAIGLFQNHYQVVEVYLDKILNSNLSDENKFKLLAAKNQQTGLSGLAEGCLKGNIAAIRVYMQRILQSNLSVTTKKELLSTSYSDENNQLISGIDIALQNGEVEAANVYRSLIHRSNLSKKDKQTLLTIKTKKAKQAILASRLKQVQTIKPYLPKGAPLLVLFAGIAVPLLSPIVVMASMLPRRARKKVIPTFLRSTAKKEFAGVHSSKLNYIDLGY